MSEFVKGQRVRVSKIVEVAENNAWNNHGFVATDGCVYLCKGWTTEILEPLGWPVCPGDVWKTDENRYIVVHNKFKQIVVYSVDGLETYHQAWSTRNLDAFRELGPELEFRPKEEKNG